MNIPHLRVGIELARLEKENAALRADLEQWWEQFQEADKERMNLRAELAMAQDGLAKGEAARLEAGGMEMEIQQLRAELVELEDQLDRAKHERDLARKQRDGTVHEARISQDESRCERDQLKNELTTAREALNESQIQAEALRCSIILFFGGNDIDCLHRAVAAYDKETDPAALAAIQPKEVPGLRELMQFEAESATKNYEVGSQPKEGES